MEICTKANWTRFTKLVPEIRQNVDQWKILSIILKEQVKSFAVINDIAVLMADFMAGWDGSIFVINEKEIACFVRMGKEVDLDKFKGGVNNNLDQYNCRITAKSATFDGLKRLEIVVSANWNRKSDDALTDLQKKRLERKEKTILVVDDDKFIRSLMSKSASKLGRVVELADGAQLLAAYEEHAPDAVFLDLHVPGKRGAELLGEIQKMDADAYVVMVSADKSREHIIETRMNGARAFIHKPITAEKMQDALKRCKTLNEQAVFDPVKVIQSQMTHYQKKRAGRTEKVIMVVDDDMFIRSLLAAAAKPFGQVIELADGSNVLDRYDALAPDAVFLDVHLPDCMGTDLLTQISKKDPDSFVVIVSADCSEDTVVKTHNQGAKGFLSKPFSPDKVAEALRKSATFR